MMKHSYIDCPLFFDVPVEKPYKKQQDAVHYLHPVVFIYRLISRIISSYIYKPLISLKSKPLVPLCL